MISIDEFSAQGGSQPKDDEPRAHASGGKNTVTYENFKQLDLRVGKILLAERIAGSEKLLKLSINLGKETRQIIAGIGTHYEPDTLIDREVLIIVNLEPRMLMGLESQGMLLAANADGPVLLVPEKEVPPGTTIR